MDNLVPETINWFNRGWILRGEIMELTEEEVRKIYIDALHDLSATVAKGVAVRINALIQEKIRRYTVNGFEPKES